MKLLFVLPIVLAILAIVGFLLKNQGKGRKDDDGPWPFFARKLLSPPEQAPALSGARGEEGLQVQRMEQQDQPDEPRLSGLPERFECRRGD